MSQPAASFNKTKWGNIPLVTYLNYKPGKEAMTLILKAMDTYEIVTSDELESLPLDIDCHELKTQATTAKTMIHL